MGYRYGSRYNRYASSGAYDSTGRYRSDAWWADGGANDEGYTYNYCHACSKQTEHESGACIPCDDRQRRRKQTAKVGDYTVTRYPNGKRYCTCQGFKYRKQCKHTAQAVYN